MGSTLLPPPTLPPGWQAVPRVDPASGRSIILLRARPLRRRLLGAAGAVGVLALWVYVIAMSAQGGARGLTWVLAVVAVSGSVGVLVFATTQDGWAVAPGRLWTGRVWVASGRWRSGREEVTALSLRPDLTDGVATMCLDALFRPYGRREIFADDRHAAIARPFAAWLSNVAGIPVHEG